MQFTTDVHREFEFPGEGFHDTRRSDLFAIRIGEDNFEMRSLLKGSHLDVDKQAITVGIWLCAQRLDARFLGRHSDEVVFGEKEIHPAIITKTKARLREKAGNWITEV